MPLARDLRLVYTAADETAAAAVLEDFAAAWHDRYPATVKLWRALAVRNLEDLRGRNVRIRSSGWKQALQAFTIYFEGRVPTP